MVLLVVQSLVSTLINVIINHLVSSKRKPIDFFAVPIIISSPLFPVLAPSSCLARTIRSSLGYILKAFSSVRYLTCILANQVQLFPGLGLYTGIFVLYLNYAWKKSRAAVILYSLCLLYVLSAVTLAGDVARFITQVSNHFYLSEYHHFFINCAVAYIAA